MMLNRSLKSINKRFLNTHNNYPPPPTYFQNLNDVPPPIEPSRNTTKPTPKHNTSNNNEGNSNSSANSPSRKSKLSTVRDFSIIFAVTTLSFLAIDNYQKRAHLEQKLFETQLMNLKNLSVQKNNFNQHRKKRDLQMLQERKTNLKEKFKLCIHVAMLRRQLKEKGLKPVDIEEVLKEFENEVKMENSINNVSGMKLWLNDDSDLKQYLPDVHDYDKKS